MTLQQEHFAVPVDVFGASPIAAPESRARTQTVAPENTAQDAVQNTAPDTAAPAPEPPRATASLNLQAPECELGFVPGVVQSFATLFRLRGRRVSGQHLLSTLGASPPTITSCRHAALELGLVSTQVYQPDVAGISSLMLPCMLLLEKENTCILVGLDGDNARIILPTQGHAETTVSLEELQKSYAGAAVFASLAPAADKLLRPVEEAEERRWFWDVVAHFGPLYRQVAVVSVMTNLLVLIGPLFVMNVYDRVVPNLALETLWVLGVGAMLGYGFELALRAMRSYFADKAGCNIDTIVATRIMQQILGMKMQDRPASSGALINHMREFDAMREFCSAGTLLVFADVPFIFLFLAMVAFIGGSIIIVPILAIAMLLTVVFCLQKAAQRNARTQQQGSVEKSAHLVEMVTGLEAIKMASAENRMLQTWEKVVGHTAHSTEEGKRITAHATNGSLFCTHMVSVFLIIWGVYLIGDNQLTVGGLIACNILTGRIMSSIVQVASLMTRYYQVRMSMRILNQFMELPQERTREAANVDFGHLTHSLELNQVTFSYPNMPLPAVRNLNLNFPAGAKIGVMGPMGSGKSTLCKLLVGLYEPSEGSVRFGGVDLRQLDVVELRTRIGYMPQEPVLFHGTVRDNIALGTPFVPDALILRAAWLAGVTDFVKQHPAGFGMEVGERGNNLSGGQRQAVSLARALLHDPDIIILDEPTSNMDGITENVIKKRMQSILEKKTLIINMHRTSLLTLVDTLLILSEGQMRLFGPRDSVIQHMNKTAQAGQADG